jgi:hypothetical protein
MKLEKLPTDGPFGVFGRHRLEIRDVHRVDKFAGFFQVGAKAVQPIGRQLSATGDAADDGGLGVGVFTA